MKCSFILVLLLLTLQLQASEKSYLLEGNVGPYPIIMNLSTDGETCGAVYFYQSSLHDIHLSGTTTGNKLTLYCNSYNKNLKRNDTSETITLELTGNNAAGGWVSNEHKKLDVNLHTVNLATVVNPFARLPYVIGQKAEDTYNYMRTASMKLKGDSIVKVGNITLEYVRVGKCPVVYPRIADGCDKEIMDKVNKLINNTLIENTCMFFSCSSYDFKLKSVFINKDVLSINTYTDYYCGGAYPDYGNDPLNLNLKTGNKLNLEDVLYLSNANVPSSESVEWLTYRGDVFAPKLIALLNSLYPKKMKEHGEDANCDYNSKEPWSFPNWYLTDKGLHLLPDFPHAAGICRNPGWSVIPFAELKKHQNPKSGITLP